ncbi:hypothetical protein EPA93_20695 [Ktedonosporobacter rubrisoli]|uniref:Tetratricopeptide repeat protein n=1 Tax=Ktedonosporobacter rubrisoli TaxID=2509675 RepID=A0A4P6JSM2_KTERU|nr:DUF6483 family protein [Ktedonosporobacter rubrisoli]QBD78285.1 hypothetical protein EPA93_20695 [Ktedonosporobacter rubrisoli]
MMNKDYILRLAEKFGRALAIILRLREYNQYEEALIYIDDLFVQSVGLTSRFINSLSEDMLLQTFSPLGILNVEACLWTATLLKAEGEIYQDQGNNDESYYRYIKSLYLFLAVLLQEQPDNVPEQTQQVTELLEKLGSYELSNTVKLKLFAYYEHLGQYAKAEDTLFELLESGPVTPTLLGKGQDFYARLLAKSESDLANGNLAKEEVREGQEQLQRFARQDE